MKAHIRNYCDLKRLFHIIRLLDITKNILPHFELSLNDANNANKLAVILSKDQR